MSTRTVAEKLKPRIVVSHATLANYETDASRPPIDIMSALATLYQRPLTWFLSQGPALTGVRYRNLKSKVGARDRQRFEAECATWVGAYAAIEKYLEQQLEAEMQFERDPEETPAMAADRFRREMLGLDVDDRVDSVIDILEQIGVRTMGAQTELAVDGLAARFGDEHVVVLNVGVSNDRARMNAAHELAHVLFGDCDDDEESKAEEKAAFEFASHLLLTRDMLRKAFERKSVVDMVRFKERFGISLAAMVHRAGSEGILTENETKRLWIEFAKRGWRSKEPGTVWPDRPTRFEAIIDSAIVQERATLSRLAEVGGVREDELKRRLALATGAEGYDDAEEEVSPSMTRGLRLAD